MLGACPPCPPFHVDEAHGAAQPHSHSRATIRQTPASLLFYTVTHSVLSAASLPVIALTNSPLCPPHWLFINLTQGAQGATVWNISPVQQQHTALCCFCPLWSIILSVVEHHSVTFADSVPSRSPYSRHLSIPAYSLSPYSLSYPLAL